MSEQTPARCRGFLFGGSGKKQYTFGTHLSKASVPLRNAQAAIWRDILKPFMMLYDPNLWSRTAVKFMPRGSSSTHIVCDAVIVAEALAAIREAHGWPLSLVAFRFERHAPGSRKGRVLVETHAIDELPRRVASGNDYFYFVRDESRHPDLSAINDLDAQAWLIINGLPLIMFNTRDADGGPGPATHFSIAGAIAHKSTWEIVRHEAEVQMYKALVARVRKLARGKRQTPSHPGAAGR